MQGLNLKHKTKVSPIHHKIYKLHWEKGTNETKDLFCMIYTCNREHTTVDKSKTAFIS